MQGMSMSQYPRDYPLVEISSYRSGLTTAPFRVNAVVTHNI